MRYKCAHCVGEEGSGSLRGMNKSTLVPMKCVGFLALIYLLTGCQAVALLPWPPSPSPSTSLNSKEDPESGWAILDEEALVKVEETENGPVLWLSERRRMVAVSEAACRDGVWPIWVQPEAQLLMVASRFYVQGATDVSQELSDRDPVVLVRDESLLGLYPVNLPAGPQCKGGVLDLQTTKYFNNLNAFREWRFGGALPTLKSRITLDVPVAYELDLRTEGQDARGVPVPFVDRRAGRQRVTLAVESLLPEIVEQDGAHPKSSRPHLFVGFDSRRPPQQDFIEWLDGVQDLKAPRSLTQRSFDTFPVRNQRLHSEVLLPQLYEATFRSWFQNVGPDFDAWALAGPAVDARLPFPTVFDVSTAGRAQTANCKTNIASHCWEDGSGVDFPHPSDLKEGPIGEGTIRLLRTEEMRHRGLREFGKVVVVSQAVATFDVNDGWATSGELTIRTYGRSPDGLGQRWLMAVPGLKCQREGPDSETCAFGVGGGREAYPWVHHLGPVLPSPAHGPRAHPARNAVGFERVDTLRFVVPDGFKLDWRGPLSVRSPRVQFDLDCAVETREVSCVRRAEFFSGALSPQSWSSWLQEWGALESMLRENFRWDYSR